MQVPLPLLVQNVLALLYCKKTVEPVETRMLHELLHEFGQKDGTRGEVFTALYRDFQKEPGKLKVSESKTENERLLCLMVCSSYFNQVVIEEELKVMKAFCAICAFDESRLIAFVRENHRLDFSRKLLETAAYIHRALFPTRGKKSRGDDTLSGYVATQICREGFDEIQQVYMAAKLGLNAALSGPPGVGKTQCVIEIAELLGLPLYTKTCSSRTTESHIISHPVLEERNGVTVTAYEDGPLCQAMKSPGIFYGDEYNLLKEDVQKRMNSAFDDRRSIDRNDGAIVTAEDGFFAVISYNPSNNMGLKDLEDSVADRFAHYYFKEWPSDLRAYISMKKAARMSGIKEYKHQDFGVELDTRGIGSDGSFCLLAGGEWQDFFTRKTVPEPEFKYAVHRVRHLHDGGEDTKKAVDTLSERSFGDVELARIFSRFTELLNDLASTGKSPLLEKLGLDELAKKQELEVLQVHKSSTRIQAAALQHYHWLRKKGCKSYLAQTYATSVIINQVVYGGYRNLRLSTIDNLSLVNTIATSFSLYADRSSYNTQLVKSKVL